MGKFRPYRNDDENVDETRLYRASTSVLLSLVVPEKQLIQEEAVHLLSNPEALWTVLVINAPSRMVEEVRQEPEKFLTPLAQFVRGIRCALVSQRIHIVQILKEMKNQLKGTVSDTHTRHISVGYYLTES